MPGEALRNFDIGFEQSRSRELEEIESSEEYIKRRDALISYNKDQMVTNLGERFNVVLSSYQYEIKNGELWGKDMDEPFIDSLKRGRDYRRENGNPIDHRRENAEVIGFEKIQKVMTDKNTPEGTIMLSISPPGGEGSIYAHNFIDIHTKKINEEGEAYMESQRVSSGLSIEEYGEKISAFADIDIDDEDPAASFLENPIAIENTLTPEDLKYYLYKDHDYMDEKTFGAIKNSVLHLISEYAESIVDRPYDDRYHKEVFNTILNKADEKYELIKVSGVEVEDKIIPLNVERMIHADIQNYGHRAVREVRAGCGISGGYGIENKEKAPFGVIEFGTNKDKYGERTFKCPSCSKENKRPYNKLIDKCQHCKSRRVAC